ncbi:MAG TPA: hypothetical protein VLJ57_20855 [Burkholderiaceae bacterium]|nr:hypothetical protein [Burkholderiaceae bacterium]
MKFAKTLTASVAAAALVGAIGFAYAQTTDSSGPGPATAGGAATQLQNQPADSTATPPVSSSTPMSSSAPPASSSDTTNMTTERTAQADRG